MNLNYVTKVRFFVAALREFTIMVECSGSAKTLIPHESVDPEMCVTDERSFLLRKLTRRTN